MRSPSTFAVSSSVQEMDRMDRQPCEIDLENMKASILTFSQKRNIQRRKRITCCSGEKKHAQKWGRTHHWLVSQTPQYGCDFLETPTVISGKFMKLPCIRYVEYIFFEQSYFKLSRFYWFRVPVEAASEKLL